MKAAQLARATPLMPLSNNCCFGKYEIPIVWFSSRGRMKGLMECLDVTAVWLPGFCVYVMPLSAIVYFFCFAFSFVSKTCLSDPRNVSLAHEWDHLVFGYWIPFILCLTFCGNRTNIESLLQSLHSIFLQCLLSWHQVLPLFAEH